jgi:GST-like protein
MARTAAKSSRNRRARKAQSSSTRGGGGKKPIDLYYWPTPNGWKITIMLEECALPYATIPVNISQGDQFKPQFLAISPNNRIPAIVDHDGPGGKPISIFESGAILQSPWPRPEPVSKRSALAQNRAGASGQSNEVCR